MMEGMYSADVVLGTQSITEVLLKIFGELSNKYANGSANGGITYTRGLGWSKIELIALVERGEPPVPELFVYIPAVAIDNAEIPSAYTLLYNIYQEMRLNCGETITPLGKIAPSGMFMQGYRDCNFISFN